MVARLAEAPIICENRAGFQGVSDGGCRGAAEVERPMPKLSDGARPPARSIARRLAAAILAVGIIATALAAPGAAVGASPGRGHAGPAIASARANPIGRSVGGQRIDAVLAARAASATPRTHAATKRLRVDLGAARARGVPASTTRNVAARSTAVMSTGAAASGPLVASVVQPPPVVATEFAGINEAEACGCEPPDPWIAVSSTHVVQTTNGLIRISNRSGAALLSIPSWALFAVPVDRTDSDPRILWDQIHQRWVGVVTSYNDTFSSAGLRLAVSETADPTGAWIVYPIETPGFLADYPGISTSSSRIVLTSDDFRDDVTFLGPTWIEMDWSNIVAGTNLYIGGVSYRSNAGDPPPGFAHFRPAIALSSAVNTPVVYEFTDSVGNALPGYFEIVGSAHAPDIANVHDLHDEFGIEPFSEPPAPVQPGALSIDRAADERPTDAVYRGGSLWFVATADYNDGSNRWARARWTRVSTTANGAAPSAASDVFAFASGTHYVMPGVGINGAGSAIFAVTAMDPVSTFPTTLVGGSMAGSGLTPLVAIGASTSGYVGGRWGDFLGIAADPAASGAVWLAHELAEVGGTWRTTVVRLVSDGTPPGLPGPVTQTTVVPSTLGATAAVKVAWGAAVDDSGVESYVVERSDDGGANFFGGQKVAATSVVQPLLLGKPVQYRITAVDRFGNLGPSRLSAIFRPTLYQSTTSTTLTGSWHSASSTSYSGNSARYSSTAGSSATFTATLARSIAIVATRATTRGSFRVYVDGVYRATISTYATTTRFRQLVYQFSWSSAGTHKVKIVISGTSGHPRVDLDAFVVLR
jgi:hypothetical protein